VFILLQTSTYTSKFCSDAVTTSMLHQSEKAKWFIIKIIFFSHKVVLQKKERKDDKHFLVLSQW
jgi:hypothetical protein